MVSRGSTVTTYFDGDTKGISAATARATRELNQFEGSVGRTGTATTMSFGAMAASVAAVGFAVGGGIAAVRAFASAASDMAETQSKVGVVFGESADAVRAWSANSAQAMGLSQQKALEAAATVGNFAQALGVAREQAAPMSQAIVQLAGDLASFNNANPEETLVALRSGLAGETEPMRRLGVAINATTVEAKAAEMGLEKLNGQFTEGAKVQARYALIMEQTKSAQGDFERTSDGLANQQRTLAASFENLRAKLGTGVTPALADATKALNEWSQSDEAVQFTDDLAESFRGLANATVFAAGGIDDVWRATKLLLPDINLLNTALAAQRNRRAAAELEAVEGGRGAGMADFESGPSGRIRTPAEWLTLGAEGGGMGRVGATVPQLSEEQLAKNRLEKAHIEAELWIQSVAPATDAAKKLAGGLSEAEKRMQEAFEITEIRNLQLAHKLMEEAELAAAAAIQERTNMERWAMAQMEQFGKQFEGRPGGITPGGAQHFADLARMGGMTTDFGWYSVDGGPQIPINAAVP